VSFAAPACSDLLVRRDDPRAVRVQAGTAPLPAPGQVLFEVERFALTANNITYAVFGAVPSFEYWRFFPAPDGWGRVPVWGYGRVLVSAHPALAEGDRFYGYWPMGSHALLEPAAAGPRGFVDGAAHRQGLSPLYNTYARAVAREGEAVGTRDAREAGEMLLRPLFTTAFLIDDFLADAGCFGARRVLVSSASSKTAYAAAFLLSRHAATDRIEVVGLTSPGHVAFVEGLGCYTRVLAYDALDTLDDTPTVYLDLSGDAGLRAAVHMRLGDALRHDCAVGAARWEHLGGGRTAALPGPKPQVFFAPGRWRERSAQWGEAECVRRLAEAREAFAARIGAGAPWMTVQEGRGAAAVEAVWSDLVSGRSRPDVGHVLSLGEP
jgi:hypothetical protein